MLESLRFRDWVQGLGFKVSESVGCRVSESLPTVTQMRLCGVEECGLEGRVEGCGLEECGFEGVCEVVRVSRHDPKGTPLQQPERHDPRHAIAAAFNASI